MIKNSLILLFLLSTFFINAQATILWEKSIGTYVSDFGEVAVQTSDKNYAVLISSSGGGLLTNGKGGTDYFLVKLDFFGNILWNKSYGGSNTDWPISFSETKDKGFIIIGWSNSIDKDVSGHHGNATTQDYWVVKIDSIGNIQWEKSLGGTNNEYPYKVKQTKDLGYIVAGYSLSSDGDVTGNHGSSDYWIVKLDSIGIIQWQKCYGGSFSDEAKDIVQTFDNGYILIGDSYSNDGDVSFNNGNGSDYWVVKIDSIGTIQWQKTLGGTSTEWSNTIIQTKDSMYVAIGTTWSNDVDVTVNYGLADSWIVKLDILGNLLWETSIGSSKDEISANIIESYSGDLLMGNSTANVSSNSGPYDYNLLKLDTTGNIIWQKTFGGTKTDELKSIGQDTDGNIFLFGTSYSNDNDVSGNNGYQDAWFVLLEAITSVYNYPSNEYITVYPNPNNGIFRIDNIESGSIIEIFDLIGNLVISKKVDNKNNYLIDLSNTVKGVYFCKITTNTSMASGRIIIN